MIGAWQAGRHTGAELVNEPGALNWNELQTRDVEGAKAFYAAVFGWQPDDQDFGGMTYTIFNVGDTGSRARCATPSGVPDEVPAFWLTYFTVEDCDASVAKVQELGGSALGPAHAWRAWGASRSSPIRTARPSASSPASRPRNSHTGAAPAVDSSGGAPDGWPALFWSASRTRATRWCCSTSTAGTSSVNGAYLKLVGYTRDESSAGRSGSTSPAARC